MDQSRNFAALARLLSADRTVLGIYKYVFLVAQIGDRHMLGMRNRGEPWAVRRNLRRRENTILISRTRFYFGIHRRGRGGRRWIKVARHIPHDLFFFIKFILYIDNNTSYIRKQKVSWSKLEWKVLWNNPRDTMWVCRAIIYGVVYI